MFKKNATRVATIGLVAAALVGTSATTAMAAPVPSGSDGPVYIFDTGNETRFPDNHVFSFSDSVVGSPSATDAQAKFQCPADATAGLTFLAPVGMEHNMSAWNASSIVSFFDGSKQLFEFAAAPSDQVQGSAVAIKAGGDYSIGLACTLDEAHLASAGVWFTTMHVTAGTGAYTLEVPDGPVVPVDPSLTDDINLEATTVAATDGVLSLVVPANTTAVIGNATLVNNLSTSTGSLGQFTVTDGRVVSHPGWTLTSTVTDFTNAAAPGVTIDKKQLGLAPKFVGTAPAGVSLSPAQVAGSATYGSPFAQADNSVAVGDTVLNADLTFVAPADKAAGVYTSKLTLTLASK
jgi:hypothetical protein